MAGGVARANLDALAPQRSRLGGNGEPVGREKQALQSDEPSEALVDQFVLMLDFRPAETVEFERMLAVRPRTGTGAAEFSGGRLIVKNRPQITQIIAEDEKNKFFPVFLSCQSAEIRVGCEPFSEFSMKKFNLFLLACSLLVAAPWAQAEPWKLDGSEALPAAQGVSLHVQTISRGGDTATLHFISFDASHLTFVVYDQGAMGRATLGETMTANHCLAGTNGGYFQPDFDPVGLLVAEGKLVRGPSRARLLSGALVVTGNHITLRRSTEPLPGKHAHEAIQSGPFLVEGARLVPGLNSARSARRTAVFTDGARRWGLVSTTALTLDELGAVLAEPALLPGGLKITRALNLDGGSSTSLWAEQPGQGPLYLHEFGIVRDFVGVVPRVGQVKK